jgi:cytochrome P450 family 142 subfamily A polypeptide 1
MSIASGDFWGGDPHPALARLRAEDPVHWDEAGQVWGITRYADVKAVSTDPATFSSAGGIRPDSGPTPMMISMDDPDHLRRRKLVNRGFTPRRVRDQEARIAEVVDRLVDGFCEAGTADMVADFAAWLPLVMIGDALGVAPEDHPTLLRWSDDLMRGQGQDDPELVAAMLGAFEGYTSYIGEVIEDRARCPRDDLMSVLVHAEVDGDRLDHDEVVYESLLILIGGDETTRHVLSGGMFQLVSHPEQWKALIGDRSKLGGAVEEVLRWVSPIKNMARTTTQDVELGGQTMAEGDTVLLVYPSANRDEDVFPDPFRFDIEREPNEHVAFGFGSHFCLGNSLARLELTVMFDRLAERLPDITLAEGITDESQLDWRVANFITGYERMPMTFTPSAKMS